MTARRTDRSSTGRRRVPYASHDRRARLRVLPSLLLAVLLGGVARAGLDAWTAGDEPGGAIFVATSVGDTCYVASEGGVLFRSTDGCHVWTRVPELAARGVAAYSIAIDVSDPTTAYAATDSGLWRTRDAGATWSEITGGGNAAGQAYRVVATDPEDPGHAFFADAAGAVWRTTTSGDGAWQSVGDGLPAAPIALVVDPFQGWAWASVPAHGTYLLVAAGAAWQPASVGLTAPAYVGTVVVDHPGGRVLVDEFGEKIYSLPEAGGPSWTLVGAGLLGDAVHLTGDGHGDAYTVDVAGRFYRLPSGTSTWVPAAATGLPNGVASAVWADPHGSGRVLAGTAGGFTVGGLEAPFAGQGPLWLSEDAGQTWTRAAAGIDAVHVIALATDAAHPGVVLAATENDGVQRSDDAGATWSASTGFPRFPVAVAVDPTRSGVVLAAVLGGGIVRSVDGGRSWSGRVAGTTGATTVAIDATGTAYAASAFIRSSDGGTTWTPLPTTGLTPAMANGVVDLARDPGDGTLWLSTDAGVASLPAGGTTWTPRAPELATLGRLHLRIDAHRSGALYAATGTAGVWRSLDGGAHWEQASHGLPDLTILDLATDARTGGTVYATGASGVYRSTDAAGSWSPLGTPATSIAMLATDADGHTLYGGTDRSGVLALTQCSTFATCEPHLLSTLPSPDALSGRARKLARRLRALEGSAGRSAAKAAGAHGAHQRRLTRRTDALLVSIGAQAAKGDAHGRLGVPLGPLQAAVALLRGVLSAP